MRSYRTCDDVIKRIAALMVDGVINSKHFGVNYLSGDLHDLSEP